MTLTYSSIRRFQTCEKKYFWRFIEELVPIGEFVEALYFGSAIHEALAHYYLHHEMPDIPIIPELKPLFQAATQSYAEYYRHDKLDIQAVEETFEVPIINPETGKSSRTFTLRGRIDLRLPQTLVEHKSTAKVTESYLSQLWSDFQIQLYTSALRQLGHPIKEVLYNVIEKPMIRQKQNETSEQFFERLMEKYSDGKLFHREVLYFSEPDLEQVQADVWQICQRILFSRRHNAWLQNRAACFHWGRACSYLPLCRSGDNSIIRENQYQHKEAHEELEDDPNSRVTDKADTTDNEPF